MKNMYRIIAALFVLVASAAAASAQGLSPSVWKSEGGALLKVLRDEAGVTVYVISHIASGPFTADKFEREMQANADTMIRALAK